MFLQHPQRSFLRRLSVNVNSDSNHENRGQTFYMNTLMLPPETRNDDYFHTIQPSDTLDPILERYVDCHRFEGLSKSCYYEPTFVVGKDQDLLSSEKNTFGHHGIKDGDTLLLLIPSSLHVIVSFSDITRNETFHNVVLPVSTPITNLKMQLNQRASKQNWRQRVSSDLLVLKDDGMANLFKETQTLADYRIQHGATLYLDIPTYDIVYSVCELGKMKRILFEPRSTIGEFRINFEKMNPHYRAPLRSAIKNAKGDYSHMYMDLSEMKFYTIESDENVYYSHDLENHYEISDLYYMLEGVWRHPFEYRHRFDESMDAGASSVVPDFVFDHTWTRAFAPQIEAESTTMYDDRAIRLYYFVEFYRPVLFEQVYSSMPFRALKNDICRREGLEAVHRVLMLCEAREGWTVLDDDATVLQYREWLDTYPLSFVVLKRNKEESRTLHRTMNVYVEWLARTGRPPVHLVVRENETVSGLRDRIEDIIQVPRFMQKLEFSGIPVEGKGTLKDIGITDGSTVTLILPGA